MAYPKNFFSASSHISHCHVLIVQLCLHMRESLNRLEPSTYRNKTVLSRNGTIKAFWQYSVM